MQPGFSVKPWKRLWVKLAIFGALGVIVTHAVHLVVANRIIANGLTQQLGREGRALAQLLTERAENALLVDDRLAVQELVDRISSFHNVGYCFFHRGETVIASSFGVRGTPRGLLRLRHPASQTMTVRADGRRYLDVAAARPRIGTARVGLRLEVLGPPRRSLSITLGIIALCVASLGAAAAFIVGRRVAQRVGPMVDALQEMDPKTSPVPLPEQHADEIGLLTRHVNQMRSRLHAAAVEQGRARHKHLQTEKLAALGSLVAGVAHEVNNPLAGMMNCQERLAEGTLSPEKQREYLALMGEGLAHIEAVMSRLLNFTRLRRPHRSRARLVTIVNSTVGLLGPATKRGQAVHVHSAGVEELEVDVDVTQIEQALANLLLNALHVSGDEAAIEVTFERGDELVGIAIRDAGPGIPAAIRDRIENPFFTTKPEGEGTGLGLSVTRTIADAHEGDLTFSFPAEGGTVATLWLPLET